MVDDDEEAVRLRLIPMAVAGLEQMCQYWYAPGHAEMAQEWIKRWSHRPADPDLGITGEQLVELPCMLAASPMLVLRRYAAQYETSPDCIASAVINQHAPHMVHDEERARQLMTGARAPDPCWCYLIPAVRRS